MGAPIGKGDWVEYIGGKHPAACTTDTLTLGRLYCVKAIVWAVGTDKRLYEAFKLVGVDLYGAFTVTAFRPIYRPKADLIEGLKAPPKSVPVRESEAA